MLSIHFIELYFGHWQMYGIDLLNIQTNNGGYSLFKIAYNFAHKPYWQFCFLFIKFNLKNGKFYKP